MIPKYTGWFGGASHRNVEFVSNSSQDEKVKKDKDKSLDASQSSPLASRVTRTHINIRSYTNKWRSFLDKLPTFFQKIINYEGTIEYKGYLLDAHGVKALRLKEEGGQMSKDIKAKRLAKEELPELTAWLNTWSLTDKKVNEVGPGAIRKSFSKGQVDPLQQPRQPAVAAHDVARPAEAPSVAPPQPQPDMMQHHILQQKMPNSQMTYAQYIEQNKNQHAFRLLPHLFDLLPHIVQNDEDLKEVLSTLVKCITTLPLINKMQEIVVTLSRLPKDCPNAQIGDGGERAFPLIIRIALLGMPKGLNQKDNTTLQENMQAILAKLSAMGGVPTHQKIQLWNELLSCFKPNEPNQVMQKVQQLHTKWSSPHPGQQPPAQPVPLTTQEVMDTNPQLRQIINNEKSKALKADISKIIQLIRKNYDRNSLATPLAVLEECLNSADPSHSVDTIKNVLEVLSQYPEMKNTRVPSGETALDFVLKQTLHGPLSKDMEVIAKHIAFTIVNYPPLKDQLVSALLTCISKPHAARPLESLATHVNNGQYSIGGPLDPHKPEPAEAPRSHLAESIAAWYDDSKKKDREALLFRMIDDTKNVNNEDLRHFLSQAQIRKTGGWMKRKDIIDHFLHHRQMTPAQFFKTYNAKP